MTIVIKSVADATLMTSVVASAKSESSFAVVLICLLMSNGTVCQLALTIGNTTPIIFS